MTYRPRRLRTNTPKWVLTVPGEVSPESALMLRATWRRFLGSSRARLAVLGNGATLERVR